MPSGVSVIPARDRGFGTANRFVPGANFTPSPGPCSGLPGMLLHDGYKSLDFRFTRTRAQSFSATNPRFTVNEAIVAGLQKIPDAATPAPNRPLPLVNRKAFLHSLFASCVTLTLPFVSRTPLPNCLGCLIALGERLERPA